MQKNFFKLAEHITVIKMNIHTYASYRMWPIALVGFMMVEIAKWGQVWYKHILPSLFYLNHDLNTLRQDTSRGDDYILETLYFTLLEYSSTCTKKSI